MNSVEMAIKMETDAISFYREAERKALHPVGKKMFLSVAEDEKRHLDMLTAVFRELDLKVHEASPMKRIKTVFEEMRDELAERVEVSKDDLEAFRIAMQMEKEGMEFYKKAAAEAATEKERALFTRLVHEEEQHYAIFANTFFFMSDSGSWFMWEEHSIVDGGTPWA